jgi:hypothetical protein
MKKITKAVFGSGRPSRTMGLTSAVRILACAENGLCCATEFLASEYQMERQ